MVNRRSKRQKHSGRGLVFEAHIWVSRSPSNGFAMGIIPGHRTVHLSHLTPLASTVPFHRNDQCLALSASLLNSDRDVERHLARDYFSPITDMKHLLKTKRKKSPEPHLQPTCLGNPADVVVGPPGFPAELGALPGSGYRRYRGR